MRRIALSFVLGLALGTMGVLSAVAADVSYYGDTNGTIQVVQLGEGETLAVSGNLNVGTEKGGATLVATGATISCTGGFRLGYQVSPGYTAMKASAKLVRTSLTSSGAMYLGLDANGGSADLEIGEDSVVTAPYVFIRSNIYPTMRFTGGRLVVTGSSQVFRCEGHTFAGGWPNPKLTVTGEGEPIDITVNSNIPLVTGYANRGVYLRGTGGLVKRGKGCLTWIWRPDGSNSGVCDCEASYTGDTHIMEGGLKLGEIKTTVSGSVTQWWQYQIPPKSPLKIDAGAYFDVASNVSTWCSISGAGFVTNSAKTVATLRFGQTVADAELKVAGAYGPMNVVKVGLGTLTASVPKIDGTLFVSNGLVRVVQGTSLDVEKIVICTGATLDARGATVTYRTLENDGCFVASSSTGLDVTGNVTGSRTNVAGRIGVPAQGTFTKTGAGALTLLGSCAKTSGRVRVAAGSLTCVPYAPFSGTYYRLQYYGDAAGSTPNGVAFSEFSLYDEYGVRFNCGDFLYTPVPLGPKQEYGGVGGIADATKLAECEVAVWMPGYDGYFQCVSGSVTNSPDRIFDGDTSTYLWNTYYWSDSNVLVFRLPDGSPDLLGFTFTTSESPSQRPNAWKLEGSVDGATWTTLAEQAKLKGDAWVAMTNSTPTQAYTEYNGGLPMALGKYPVAKAYSVFGSAVVAVDAGATLDLPSDLQQIESLEVDCEAGAGTLTKLSLASQATISLVHAPASLAEGKTYALPLTVNAMATSRSTLRTARIVCDDVEQTGLGLSWNAAEGRLEVRSRGMIIMLR